MAAKHTIISCEELVSDEEDDEEPIQLTDHDKELFLKAMRKVNGGKNENIQ